MNMRSVGLVLLAISVLLGGLAVWGLHSLGRPAAPRVAAAPSAPTTTVVVASRALAFGEAIAPGDLKTASWPAGATPPGSFRSVSDIVGGPPRRVLSPIAPNEPILAARISGPGGRATLANAIAPGMRAATLRVDDVAGVAGFVTPGDVVDVLATRPDGTRNDESRTDIVVAGARVLAIDQSAGTTKSDPTVAKAATVEVTPAQAQKIALAAHVGALTLALRGADEPVGTIEAARTIRTADLTLAAPGTGPRVGGRVLHVVRRAGGPTIKIYRGADLSRVLVRSE